MKRLLILFELVIIGLCSCKNAISRNDNLSSESNRKEELIKIALTKDYKIPKEIIINDVSAFINSTENSRNVLDNDEVNVTILDCFTHKIQQSVDNVRSSQIDEFEGIDFYLLGIESKNNGFNEIAIVSDDRRIGEVLMLMNMNSLKKDISDNPFMQLMVLGLENYVNNTIDIWNSITDNDLICRKERSMYEDTILDSNYTYKNWKINKTEHFLQTRWGQKEEYAAAIQHYYGKSSEHPDGDKYVAGCGAIALAQIMAYKTYPKSCSSVSYNKLNSTKWAGLIKLDATKWNGVYDWNEIKKSPYAYKLKYDAQNQLAAFIFDVAEGIQSEYEYDEKIGKKENKASTISKLSDQMSYLSSIGYKYDAISSYSFDNVKDSIDKDCPVLILGYSECIYEEKTFLWWKWKTDKIIGYDNGHFWVIDGYATGTCLAENINNGNITVIENGKFVHCNPGWELDEYIGYYFDGIFDMTYGAMDRSSENNSCYKYNLKTVNGITPVLNH